MGVEDAKIAKEELREDRKNEDPRYYIDCPRRKGGPRIAVTVCIKKCIYARRDITFDPADPMAICGWGKDFSKKGRR